MGLLVGAAVGLMVGAHVGFLVGMQDGLVVGSREGSEVGSRKDFAEAGTVGRISGRHRSWIRSRQLLGIIDVGPLLGSRLGLAEGTLFDGSSLEHDVGYLEGREEGSFAGSTRWQRGGTG
jgi:uncharacterized membrane protein